MENRGGGDDDIDGGSSNNGVRKVVKSLQSVVVSLSVMSSVSHCHRISLGVTL